MIPWPWATTWITGASSGIGAALAREIAAPGLTLVLSGRSVQRLTEVARACTERGADVVELVFELESHEERVRALRELKDREIEVDAFVNNAGVSQRGLAVETAAEVDRRIFEIDYFAGVELTKALLSPMIAAGRGCIVAISSIAALAGAPLRSSYGAAKSAQIRFFDTLRNELSGSGVLVSTVIVGMVQTDISRNSLTAAGGRHELLDPNQARGISSARVASEIVQGVTRRSAVFFAGMTMRSRIMVLLSRIAPRLLDRILSKGRVT